MHFQRRSLILLTLITYAALLALAFFAITPPRGNTFDFYPRYVGARAMFGGESPYSEAITARIQDGMYGMTVPPDSDQQRFAYPAYAGILIAPFAVFTPRLATALWMALQPVTLIWSCLLWLEMIGWRFRRAGAAWLLAAAVIILFRYPFALYLLGQFTGVIALCIALGAWWLVRRKPSYSGIAFALATIQPTITAPLALLSLGYAAVRERGAWRGLAAFLLALGVLAGVSALLIGWWLPEFIDGLRAYAGYATYYLWPPSLIESDVMRLLFVLGTAAAAVFSIRRAPAPNALIGAILTFIPITVLLIPQTGSYYLILLIPLILASLHNAARARGSRRWMAWALSLAALLAPWLYLIMPESERQYEALLLPLQAWATWLITARL